MRFLCVAVLLLLSSIVHAAPDKWGGDDRAKNPTSKYQVGTATATGNFTLTDGGKNWGVNTLAGLILQPNTSAEVYYLIKSNTATEITVYGVDTNGHDEECNRHISDDNAGTGQYAVLDRWSVQKVDGRWWLFDPYGNAFFAKSVNDFGVLDVRFGSTIGGTDYKTTIDAKFGGHGTTAGGFTANLFNGVVDQVKQTGFNALGSTIDASYTIPGSCYSPNDHKTAARYMPFISQVRVGQLTNANTDKFTTTGATIADAFDADFQSDVVADILSGTGSSSAATEGYRLFDVDGCSNRSGWLSWFLTPYAKAKYNIPANPYFIGYDWDEEPPYVRSQGSDVEHLGYSILTSAAGTPRKTQAIAVLQGEYATIGDLNASWGTNYADWDALTNDTGTGGINGALSNEPYCYYWLESNANMLADLDLIAEDFWRTYTQKVHDALDALTTVHVLNYGPAYHGWVGVSTYSFAGATSPEYLFRGSVSEDGTTPYIDVIAIGDPLHGPHTSATPDFYEHMGPRLKEFYEFHGRPYHHESVWITAEADSAIAQVGTVTGLTSNILTDSAAHFDGDGVNVPGYVYGTAAPRRMVLINPGANAPGSRKYFSVCRGNETNCPTDSITDTTFGIRHQISDSSWNWLDGTGDMTTAGAIGQPYVFIAHDAFGQIKSGASYPLFVPLTQADRGTMYADFINDAMNFKAANDDYLIVGFSHWSWFDFSFKSNGTETRNFGLMTIQGNLYDGSATIANGEVQNTGDAITPVRLALTSLYNVLPDAEAPTITAFSISSGSNARSFAASIAATDADTSVTGYCITTVNNSSSCTWHPVAPAITPTAAGTFTYYAFVKDEADNISTAATTTKIFSRNGCH